MLFKELEKVLFTDEFTIVHRETVEFISGTERGSYRALKKYFDMTIEKVVPLKNGIEIHLK